MRAVGGRQRDATDLLIVDPTALVHKTLNIIMRVLCSTRLPALLVPQFNRDVAPPARSQRLMPIMDQTENFQALLNPGS